MLVALSGQFDSNPPLFQETRRPPGDSKRNGFFRYAYLGTGTQTRPAVSWIYNHEGTLSRPRRS